MLQQLQKTRAGTVPGKELGREKRHATDDLRDRTSGEDGGDAGHSPDGPGRSLEAVEYATLDWVDWYNNRRLLEPIGNMPPAEAKASYDAKLEELALAA
jgi:transposase InsO family protein